jgi:hypothetical protein
MEGDQEVVKRSVRDESIQVVIQPVDGAMLGIFLYSYLYLKLAKMLCLSYYLLYFLFNKIGEEEGRRNRFCLEGSGCWGQRWPKQCIHK